MEDNDDEDVWDEDDEYLAMIAAEGARLRASKRGESLDAASDGVEDDDDEEEDEDIDEELNVETPLDSIDPYIRFKAALSGDLFLSLKDASTRHSLNDRFCFFNSLPKREPSGISGRDDIPIS